MSREVTDRRLKAREAALPDGPAMGFRIGVHAGAVPVEGERLYGDSVNTAARQLRGWAGLKRRRQDASRPPAEEPTDWTLHGSCA